jgi:hypothetical protein
LASNLKRIHSVLKSGEASVEAEGLTLSVAIEGLLNENFSNLASQNDDFGKNLSEAKTIICSSQINPEIKKRLNGFMGAMQKPRGKDHLYFLRDANLIQNDLIESWEKLRNPSAHGDYDVADWRDVQKYIDRCSSALVLFYQLIFLAIGYQGKFTDYSKEGFPTEIFGKKLP